MYIPGQFEETRAEVLHEAVRSIRLAMLVTAHDGAYNVTHVPMMFGARDGATVLECHVARANGHWKALDEPRASIAIFQGPHAYISPSWYASKREDGKVVPTWNYIAVHVNGVLSRMDEDAELLAHLNAMTDDMETGRSEPWSVADAPERYITQLRRGIVGLRLEVQGMEGAWKMIQHKSEGDRKGATQGLAASRRAEDREVAAILERLEAARED